MKVPPAAEVPGSEEARGATLRHVLGWLRPYPYTLPTVALLGLVASLAEGLGIVLLIPFLAALGDGAGEGGALMAAVDAYAALFPPEARTLALAASVSLAAILSALSSVAYVRVLSGAATRVAHDLRVALFERFVHEGAVALDENGQGRRLKALDGAAHRAGQAVISVSLLAVNAATVAVLLVLLGAISWRMTLVVFAGIGVAGLGVRALIARGTAAGRAHERASSRLADIALQTIGNLRTVRVFGQERRELEAFAGESARVRTHERTLETLRRASDPIIDAIAVPLLVAGLVAAAAAEVEIAVLLPFLLLVFRLLRHVREFDASRVWLAADAGAVREVSALLAAPVAPPPEDTVAFERLVREIRFEGVSFVHGGDPARAPSLSDVSFTVRRGETLGIVGGSGAGKSTLIDLLCGLHRPSAGTIRIDGTPLERLDPATWRRRIGFAGQDAELRAGSVRENIAYGEPDAFDARVREAAERAGAARFIERLPEGYDTFVGPRGLALSGGERQRIALARALIRCPELLVLDEATSALDSVSEALVRETLERLAGSLTMIVVTHRLASIRGVDRVLVLEGGRLVEEGSPAALSGGSGAFREFEVLEGGTRSRGAR